MGLRKFTYPKTSLTASFTEEATVANGGALTPVVKVMAGYDGAAVRVIKTDASGRPDVTVESSALPAGAATSANQTTGNTSLGSIDTKLTSQATAANQTTGNTSLGSIDTKLSSQATAANQAADAILIGPVAETAPGTDTASSGLNGRLQRIAQRLTSLIALIPASLGQKTMANSLAVVFASDQSSIPVANTFTDATGSGSITTQNLVPAGAATAGSSVALSLNGHSVVTVQVTGVYTGALSPQATIDGTVWVTLNGLLNVNTGALAATITTGQLGIFQVDVAGFNQFRISALAAVTGTGSITLRGSVGTGLVAIDSPLPAGANIIGALTANQSANVAQINAVTPLMGNGVTGTGSLRVTLASDTSSNTNALLFRQSGKARANAPTRNDYTSVNVTTGAYVTLVASLSAAVTELEIFDSSGQTLSIATGAAASEVDQIFVFPGGNGRVPLAIASGTRVSIRATSATASVGEIAINWYA